MEPDARRATPAGRFIRLAGVLAATGFVALLVYGVVAQAPDTSIDDALAADRAVATPGFRLEVLADGRPEPLAPEWDAAAEDGVVGLEELRGTPVVLNFWASWCDPCRQEARLLQRGWERGREDGVLFLGLDMQDVREDARAFLREFGQDYPQVRDPTRDTLREWGGAGLPETFFISREGKVVGHVIGALDERQMADGVAAALAGEPQAADRGGAQRPAR